MSPYFNMECPRCGRRGRFRRGIGFEHQARCGECDAVWDPHSEGYEPLSIMAGLIQVPEAERDQRWWDQLHRLEEYLERKRKGGG